MIKGVKDRLKLYGGVVVQLCALVFLGYVLVANMDRLRNIDVLRPEVLVLMCSMTSASVLMVILLVVGWRELLLGSGASQVSFRSAFWVIGRTAIAKYLPGNVFQYVGRQMFGKMLGANQSVIFGATLGEVMIVASVSCLIALSSIPFATLPMTGRLPDFMIAGVLITGAISPLLCWFTIPWISRYRAFRFLEPMSRIKPISWARSFFGYGACLLLGAGIFLMISIFFMDSFDSGSIPTLIAAYGISYAFGFMVPGAPGGLGVREALIVLIAGMSIDQSVLVTAAIVQRLSSIFGEAICFACTYAMKSPRSPIQEMEA